MMIRITLATGSLALGLTACSPARDHGEANAAAVPTSPGNVVSPASNAAAADDANTAAPPKSILRPEIVAPVPEAPAPQPIDATIGFGDAGSRLDDAGRQALDTMLANPAVQAGGAITLRGHSDSCGNDRVNLAVSRKRAEAVRDYLLDKGIDAGRITVIAMGETSPLVPNAHPDGSDDPDARTRNRRVAVHVALPDTTDVRKGDGAGEGGKPDKPPLKGA